MPRLKLDVCKFPGWVHLPFSILLLINLIIGCLTFQEYGASWDEPGFYQYASSIPYAYSLKDRLSGHFEIEKAYGPPQEGNKMYGPAYLLLAGALVKILTSQFQISWYPAWHLVNFLTFQAGIIFFYRLCLRWLNRRATFAATLLFSTQPVLWGHAFINPKDIPFMSFFIAAIFLGFWSIDRLAAQAQEAQRLHRRFVKYFLNLLPAAVAIGLLASIRMLGPFAGILVALYALLKYGKRSIPGILGLALVAFLVNYLTWPYLWENPFAKYYEVIRYMSENPVIVSVLFQGVFYRSNNLPFTYFPTMLSINLTEVVWLLFCIGSALLAYRKTFQKIAWQSLLPVLLWFLLPLCYIVLFRPPLYDGLRHFLFILPPVFIIAGFAFELLFTRFQKIQVQAILILLVVISGVAGICRLFPYEYTYYNLFVGGTGGAFRRFETDFWLTCYKETLEDLQKSQPAGTEVYVLRNPRLAGEYAGGKLQIEDLWHVKDQLPEGSLMLFTTRFNDDLNLRYYEPLILSVGKAGADFCIVRQVAE